jgi:DinB superfamily
VSHLSVMLGRLAENRRQTARFIAYLKLLALNEARERGSRPEVELARLLAVDPGPGGRRSPGPIGWHLLHVAVFEEGCFGAPPRPELWERFAHGQPPFVPALSLEQIEGELATTRAGLLGLTGRLRDDLLDVTPPDVPPPGMTYRDLLEAAVWHEPHHLAQCNDNLRMQFISAPGE